MLPGIQSWAHASSYPISQMGRNPTLSLIENMLNIKLLCVESHFWLLTECQQNGEEIIPS